MGTHKFIASNVDLDHLSQSYHSQKAFAFPTQNEQACLILKQYQIFRNKNNLMGKMLYLHKSSLKRKIVVMGTEFFPVSVMNVKNGMNVNKQSYLNSYNCHGTVALSHSCGFYFGWQLIITAEDC